MGVLGDFIYEARVKKGKSLRAMAAEVDISPMYLSEIQSGKKIPLAGFVLEKIAAYLNEDAKELVSMAFQDKQHERLQKMDQTPSLIAARIRRDQESITTEVKKLIDNKEVDQ